MSRSYRQPVLKDGCKSKNKIWLRVQKRSQKNYLKAKFYDIISDPDFVLNIPDKRNIVNIYTLCDWIWSYNIPFTQSFQAKRIDKGGKEYFYDMKNKLSRK